VVDVGLTFRIERLTVAYEKEEADAHPTTIAVTIPRV
jgi:hypothetical protein